MNRWMLDPSIGLRFRGRSCPGLIEALDGMDGRDRKGSGFRGEAAPASLKRKGSWGFAFRLGGFRGEAAPASLKPARIALEPHTTLAFPGRSCPGLIEASCLTPPLRPSYWFPGRSCPGLIEAERQPVGGVEGDLSFRGEAAPASLKPLSPDRRKIAGHVSGGEAAPASLKHWVPDTADVARFPVSGAKLPRPH